MSRKRDLELFAFGDKALAKKLHKLANAPQKKIMRKALRNEAKALRETMRALVPKDSGQLGRKLQVRSLKRSRTRFGMVVRTPPRDKLKGIPRTPGTMLPGYYPAHLELGTKRVPAKPFMRPARDQHAEGLLGRVGRDLWEGLRELAAKEAQAAAAPKE